MYLLAVCNLKPEVIFLDIYNSKQKVMDTKDQSAYYALHALALPENTRSLQYYEAPSNHSLTDGLWICAVLPFRRPWEARAFACDIGPWDPSDPRCLIGWIRYDRPRQGHDQQSCALLLLIGFMNSIRLGPPWQVGYLQVCSWITDRALGTGLRGFYELIPWRMMGSWLHSHYHCVDIMIETHGWDPEEVHKHFESAAMMSAGGRLC